MKLRIFYTDPQGVNMKLDAKIIKAFKELDIKFYASGCNNLTGERELCFDVA